MKKFLKITHSKDLLIRCQLKHLKLSGSLSHARWEKSKYSQNIKGFWWLDLLGKILFMPISEDSGTLHLIVEQKDFISCLTSIQSPSTELLPCSIQDRVIKKSVKNSDTKSGPLEALWKASKEKECSI